MRTRYLKKCLKAGFSRHLRICGLKCVSGFEINLNEVRMARSLSKRRPGETIRVFLSHNSRRGGQLMRIVQSTGWVILCSLLCVATILLLLNDTLSVSAQIASPPSSSISSSSGSVSWDFAAVGGGTATNVGIQGICPAGMCDSTDLAETLPSLAPAFYQTPSPI